MIQHVDPDVLREYIREQGVHFDQTAASYVFTCPRCSGKKKLYIRKKDGRFVCWRCKETDGFQGRVEFALAALLGISVKEVRGKLYGDQAVEAEVYLDVQVRDFFDDGEADEVDVVEHVVHTWPFDYYPIDHEHAARGLAYLEGRGVTAEVAKRYGLRYSPVERRVVFPVESQGILYGWQGRIIVPNEWYDKDGEKHEIPKILSSDGLRRDRLLMFSDRLRGSGHAVLLEGPVDGMKADLCEGNVVTMGKAVSPQQVALLRNAGLDALYLGLDPDAAAETARLAADLNADMKLYQMLARGVGKADIGAMRPEEVLDLFRGAPRINPGRVFVYLAPDRPRLLG